MATTLNDFTLTPTTDRARELRCQLDRACLDGSLILTVGEVSDLFVDDQNSLRGLLPVISCWGADRGMPTLVYSLAHGLRAFDYPGGPTANVPGGVAPATPPTSALDIAFDSMQAGGQPTTLVLDHIEGLLPDGQPTGSVDTARIREQVLTRATDPVWRSQGHRLVLVSRTGGIDQRIARHPGVVVARLGLPELSEREAALRLMMDSPSHPLALEPSLSFDDAVRRSGGLRLDLISRLRLQTGTTAPLTTAQLVDAKTAAIQALAGDSLTLYDQDLDLDADVAGLPQVRRYVAERQAKGDYSLRLILVGPPGNGKNWVARAVARAMGVPAVELGRILGRYVGESEENLDRAIEAIEAIAPVMVIMDEIDQGPLGRRGESHGTDGAAVNANLRARLFGWLGDVGDRRGISVVGMTNRADLLDEAAADRFTFIPILHPAPFEAAQIMAIQARREGLDFDADAAALALSSSPRAFSGRQAVRLLDSAQTHALERSSRRIEAEDTEAALLDALSEVGEAEKLQSLLALAYTTWNRHLPWNAARYLGDPSAEPPAHLRAYVKAEGSIDRATLDRAIGELRGRV